jgi:membrane protein DedA with SNARE-associated domain
MEETLLRHGLPLAALFVLASSAGIPTGVPVKAVLLTAGALLVASPADLPAAFGLLLLAEVAGTLAVHLVGGAVGPRVVRRLPGGEARLASALARWRGRLGGRDALAVFVLRFVPVVRIGVAAGSGVLGLRRRDFLLGAAPAACLWVGVPFGLGWTFRDDVATVEAALRSAAGPIVAAVAVAAAGTVAVRVAMNRRATARTVR